MRGAITHPLIIGRALPLLIILCGAAGLIIVIVPLLIPPPLLLLSNGPSVVSSVGRGGTPLGIDVQRQKLMIL